MNDDRPSCPCKWCGVKTFYTGTKECDFCHNVRAGMHHVPDTALRLMLEDHLGEATTIEKHAHQLLNKASFAAKMDWYALKHDITALGHLARLPAMPAWHEGLTPWQIAHVEELHSKLKASPMADPPAVAVQAEPDAPVSFERHPCSSCGMPTNMLVCSHCDATKPAAPATADDAVSDAEVFAIFRANCVDYPGNYEVTPGQALRIAKRILALHSGAFAQKGK